MKSFHSVWVNLQYQISLIAQIQINAGFPKKTYQDYIAGVYICDDENMSLFSFSTEYSEFTWTWPMW